MNLRAVGMACCVALATSGLTREVAAADPWFVITGTAGPGLGRRVVLISGDEEYRSEEALPQLAKILAQRHGFTCTVLFAIGPTARSRRPGTTTSPAWKRSGPPT